ncbi:MAG TPA: ABC transporter permease subunit [Anaerolineales bacterium]|nr:ABC transporter permease subunit [Anaerolineales bacterium]
MKAVWVIVRKEWREVFRNRMVFFTVAFLPLLFTALPIAILAATRNSVSTGDFSTLDLPEGYQALCGGLTGAACAQYALVSQFMILFMMIPLIIPVTIASYSIVGEKITRTLEPLLATPVSTLQLLGGKALAAVLPAVAAAWGGFAVFAVGARLVAIGPEVLARLVDPLWLMAIFVLGPLLSLASVAAAVMVSSRSTDPRAAEQVAMVVIVPLLGLFFGQIAGLFVLNAQLIAWMAGVLAVVDVGLMAFAVSLFQRETILTRWR